MRRFLADRTATRNMMAIAMILSSVGL